MAQETGWRQIYFTRRNDDGKTVFTLIKWGSPIYQETIQLRNQVLTKSAGKPLINEFPIEEKEDIHLVIKREKQIIGTLLLHPCSKECIQIKQVAIAPSCQSEGLGKKLIVYAEQVARRLGYSTIFLTGRQQAWGFYEKLGYEELFEPYREKRLLLKLFKKNLQAALKTNKKELKTNG